MCCELVSCYSCISDVFLIPFWFGFDRLGLLPRSRNSHCMVLKRLKDRYPPHTRTHVISHNQEMTKTFTCVKLFLFVHHVSGNDLAYVGKKDPSKILKSAVFGLARSMHDRWWEFPRCPSTVSTCNIAAEWCWNLGPLADRWRPKLMGAETEGCQWHYI